METQDLPFFGTEGVHTNINKTEIFLIRCDGIDLQHILAGWPGQVKDFPCRHLGCHSISEN